MLNGDGEFVIQKAKVNSFNGPPPVAPVGHVCVCVTLFGQVAEGKEQRKVRSAFTVFSQIVKFNYVYLGESLC